MAFEVDSAELDPDSAWSSFRRHHAFIVGIDNYVHVSPLRTAVNDASRLADELRDQHGFEVHGPLLDATGAQMRELLQETLKKEVGPDDRVLFYFAGHGVAADGADGPAGYLVPADAQKTDLSTYIPMADLQVALDALPCRHLLLVLDCCFSGAFKWSTSHRAISGLMPKLIYEQRFARFIQDPARQIITSAAYDQKALDVLNGQPTGDRGAKAAKDGRLHSPFALALFDALAGDADVKLDQHGDGAVTATEIYSFIRDRIEPATMLEGANLRQTPSFFPLKGHDKGEFMFRNPRHPFNMPRMQGKSPFKGLASFDKADRHLFYGRDRVVAELARRAADKTQRLLVVVGPSGTGKSSVIKAGLMPQLEDDGLAVVVMRPGEHPLAELDKALADGSEAVVLIIDQYEELITRCADVDGERKRFDRRLHELLGDGDRVERIVITVRSDFEPLLNGWALKEAWSLGRFTVPPFSVEDLRQVILLPTIQEVMIFEPESLVDQIIDEVVQSPGALPLLSYTLNELFQAYVRRGGDKRDLTLADYTKLGGVLGALRTKADDLYKRELASDDERDAMRKIMLRMVSVEGELAGRRVPKGELDFAGVDPTLVATVIGRLDSARLVVFNEGGIEPAHDALVRAWDTLRDWIHKAGRDNLILGKQLQIATEDHLRTGSPEYLWNDNPNLAKVRKLAEDTTACWFNRDEMAFIEASVRRKTRRLRIAGLTAALLFAIVSGLGIWGWVEQTNASNSIAAAGDFTDNMLGEMMKKLRIVERTQDARKHLMTSVRELNRTLSTRSGADLDQETSFWTHLLEGDADLEKARLETVASLEDARYREAAEHYQKAVAVAEQQLVGKDSSNWRRNLSIVYGQLGDMAKSRADFNEARRRYQQALEVDKSLAARPGSGQLALRDEFVSHFRLADLERRHAKADPLKLGKPFQTERRIEARRQFELAHTLAKRLVGQYKDDAEARRDLAMALVELGNSSLSLGRSATDEYGRRALDEYRNAVDWAKQWPVEEVLHHSDTRTYLDIAYTQLGFLQLNVGQLAAAREALGNALTLSFFPDRPGGKPKVQPTEDQQSYRYTNYLNLATIESRDGNVAAARSAFGEALGIAHQEIAAGRLADVWQQRADAIARSLAKLGVSSRRERVAKEPKSREAIEALPSPRPLATACRGEQTPHCPRPH